MRWDGRDTFRIGSRKAGDMETEQRLDISMMEMSRQPLSIFHWRLSPDDVHVFLKHEVMFLQRCSAGPMHRPAAGSNHLRLNGPLLHKNFQKIKRAVQRQRCCIRMPLPGIHRMYLVDVQLQLWNTAVIAQDSPGASSLP